MVHDTRVTWTRRDQPELWGIRRNAPERGRSCVERCRKEYDIRRLADMRSATEGHQMTASETTTPTLIFDGHNDTILDLMATGRSFYERSDQGHIDRVRAAEGGLAGGG